MHSRIGNSFEGDGSRSHLLASGVINSQKSHDLLFNYPPTNSMLATSPQRDVPVFSRGDITYNSITGSMEPSRLRLLVPSQQRFRARVQTPLSLFNEYRKLR